MTIRLDELGAVNRMLLGIGKTPVNTLTNSGLGDVAAARLTLDQVSFEIQAPGHRFNTRFRTLTPRVEDSRVVLPNDVIHVESLDARVSYYVELDTITPTIRYLANEENNSLVWASPQEVRVVLSLPFDALPGHASDYIAAEAALRFQNQRVGSPSLEAPLERARARAYANFRKAELRQSGANLIDDRARLTGRSVVYNRHRSQRYS